MTHYALDKRPPRSEETKVTIIIAPKPQSAARGANQNRPPPGFSRAQLLLAGGRGAAVRGWTAGGRQGAGPAGTAPGGRATCASHAHPTLKLVGGGAPGLFFRMPRALQPLHLGTSRCLPRPPDDIYRALYTLYLMHTSREAGVHSFLRVSWGPRGCLCSPRFCSPRRGPWEHRTSGVLIVCPYFI